MRDVRSFPHSEFRIPNSVTISTMPNVPHLLPSRTTALLALALLAPIPTIGVATALYAAPGTVGQVVFTVSKIWLVAFPAVWYLAVERGSPSWSPPRRGGLWMGALIGVIMSLAIAVGYWTILARHIDPATVRLAAVTMELSSMHRYALAAAGWIFINSVVEEYVYRWFVLRQLRTLMPNIAAIGVSAGIFTVHHVVAMSAYLDPGPTLLGSLGVFTGGAVWCWLYNRYGSIWPGWISHAIVDVAVFVIGAILLFG